MRDFGVKLKLNPVRTLLEGKRVVLIDDSIVRGTTSRKIVRMIRNAGAKEVHMRISCPPTISPCFYGVDTPSKKELIAANKSIEEIREFIGADSLAYLSLEGMKKACGDGEKTTYCTACYTGKYPTNWVDVEEILAGRGERRSSLARKFQRSSSYIVCHPDRSVAQRRSGGTLCFSLVKTLASFALPPGRGRPVYVVRAETTRGIPCKSFVDLNLFPARPTIPALALQSCR